MRAAMATSAASPLVPGLPEKFMQNCYAEPNPTDPERPVVIMETAGTLKRNTYAAACRGMWQADGFASGVVLVPQGTTLSTYNPSTDTASSISGTISGSDRGDAAFTETEALFLFNGQPYRSEGTLVRRASDGVTSSPGLVIGSTPANVANVAFTYSITGVDYSKGAVAAGTAPGNDVVPIGKYGAVALDINAAGTITAVEAPANATGYTSASEAAAALPEPAAGLIRMGYVTASKSDGSFTFGTTSLAAANTTVAYTDASVNTGFTDLLADHDQTAFTSVASLGQRGLLTYGNRFAFTDVLAVNSTDALNYYTAESSPDSLIAGRVVGEYYYLFGTKTLEVWAETGDSDDPYAIQPGLTQQVGCACRDGIVRADNTLFFVDDNFNVRRMGQGSSQVISEAWVQTLLKDAGASSIIGQYYEERGHIFVGWRTPSGTVYYDVQTQAWHTRKTLNTATWRYTDVVTAASRTFVCDGTGQFDEMSRDYFTESMANEDTDGTYIQRMWTALLSSAPPRLAIKTVKVEAAKGIGVATGQGDDPVLEMSQSFDGGNTFTSWNSKKLGEAGEYGERTIWRRRGRVKDKGVIFRFRKTDPVRTAYLGVVVNEDSTR